MMRNSRATTPREKKVKPPPPPKPKVKKRSVVFAKLAQMDLQ